MHPYLWFSLRLVVVACFFVSGFTMANDIPSVPPSAFWVFAATANALFAAWRFYSILAALWRQKKEGHDWNASLWFSPILKNPQNFHVLGGASIACAGSGFVAASRAVFPGMFFVSFGLGTLAGVLIFRLKVPNQTPEPMPLTRHGSS